MFSFLYDLTRDSSDEYTVIVMDAEGPGIHRQYEIRPRKFVITVAAGLGVLGVGLLIVLLFTPVKDWLPGGRVSDITSRVREQTQRLVAIQDSLELQQTYLEHLRDFIVGDDSLTFAVADSTVGNSGASAFSQYWSDSRGPLSVDWADHVQPAIPVERINVKPPSIDSYLSGLRLPVLPPITGFITRGFDARTGHYGIDVAVDEGSTVRSVGDGYVIFADWTHQTGYVIVVQHSGGYASLYKHNMRLLKQVGDRIRAREALAITGNSGEITTGPHLHFELWHEGLAQDPRPYIIGW